MAAQRKKLLILVALLGLWALIFGLRTPGGRAPRPAAEAPPPRLPAREAELPRLKLELLEAPRAPYPSEVQSIFGAPPAPPPPPQLAGRGGGPGGTASAPPPPPPPPDPFMEEAKQLRFVGYLRAGSSMTAFITRGSEIHSMGAGGLLQGRYRVKAVTEQEVVLTSPQGDKEVRLPMTPAPAGAPPRPGAPPPPRVPPGGFSVPGVR